MPTDPVRGENDELFSVRWYNGEKLYLAQSAQMYKQMAIAAGLPKVFLVAPFWRKEMNLTKRHLSEAWSLDIELTGVQSHRDVMSVATDILRNAERTMEAMRGSLSYIGEGVDLISDGEIPIICYDEAVNLLNENDISQTYGEDLGTLNEFKLAQIMWDLNQDQRFFIEKYPDTVKKFYVDKIDGTITQTFDLIYKGWELMSGAKRDLDKKRIIESMTREGMDVNQYKEYLSIFTDDLPAHGGFGMGLDRLVAKLLNIGDVRETLLFPRTKYIRYP